MSRFDPEIAEYFEQNGNYPTLIEISPTIADDMGLLEKMRANPSDAPNYRIWQIRYYIDEPLENRRSSVDDEGNRYIAMRLVLDEENQDSSAVLSVV